MKVQLIDPSAFTPPYDRALAAALARAGAEVELLTSRFLHGAVPPAEGYRVRELFYRRAAGRGLDAPARLPFKAAEHLPGMLRLRRAPRRPRLMTAHYILPPGASRRAVRSAHRVFDAMDAVVAHSEHSAARLREEVG